MSSLSQNLSASADAVPDTRLSQLNEWLATTGLVDVASGRRASVDASFRRYFRYDVVAGMQDKLGATLVAMDAPPERENVPAFVHVQGLLLEAGVSVPAIAARNIEQGFLLLSDLGNTTYLSRLSIDNAAFMYSDAVDALLKFQMASQPDVLPEFDRAYVMRELGIFPEWYLGKHLGVTLDAKQQAQLDGVFEAIAATCWRSSRCSCTAISIRAT